MDAAERYILALCGTQSGKTVLGPWWLMREIRRRGPGDYLVVAPSYPLMQKKVLPEFKKLFQKRCNLGSYKAAPRIFEINDFGERSLFGETQGGNTTQIFFGHAQDPDSLESATAKGAWLDEAGQKKFKFGSWEAIIRRLSIYQGRVLITTTPYTLGWLKNEIHDKAATDENIRLIQFDSLKNPAFPLAEFQERSRKMPRWKFNMMYKGIFERPAGMIYDSFTSDNKVQPFSIPPEWPRLLGYDFGGVNTVVLFLAQSPITKKWYVYREYGEGGKTAAEHAKSVRAGEPGRLPGYGGAPSEDQWRREFGDAGLRISRPPVGEVEVGISRLYSLFKENKLFIFEDCTNLIADIESYSRVLDEENEPTEEIEDKSLYHYADALRYPATAIAEGGTGGLGAQKANV